MVAIPTVLHIGNDEIHGTFPRVPTRLTPLASLDPYKLSFGWTYFKYASKLNWVTPWNNDGSGTIISPLPYAPFFDINLAGGLGDFAPHHIVSNIIGTYVLAQGDNPEDPSNTTAFPEAKQGFGSSAWLMKLLPEYFTASPYFKYIKVFNTGGMSNNWQVGNAGHTKLVSRITRCNTLVSPDTLDLKLIIIDTNGDGTYSPYGDIYNYSTGYGAGGATYKNRMKALIDNIRGTIFNAPDALVVIISHAPSYLLTSGTSVGALLHKSTNYDISREMSNVVVYEMRDSDLAGSAAGYGDVAYGANRKTYDAQAYIEQANGIFSLFKRWTERATRPSLGNVIPTFISVTDSQGVGELSPTWQAYNYSQTLNPYPDGVRTNQWIYNAVNGQIEKVQSGVSANFNSLGTVNAYAGPIYMYSKLFADYYPDGVLFFNMTKNSASVSASPGAVAYTSTAGGRYRKGLNENYEQMSAHIQAGMNLAVTQSGAGWSRKTPVVHAFIIQLGDNDTGPIGSGNLNDANRFKSELRNLILNLRNDFGFSHYGIQTPVILVRPHITSILGSQETRTIVRTAITELTEELPNIGWVNIDDLALDYISLHYAPESILEIGERIYAKYLELLDEVVPNP